jgi:hypothetical protein
MFEKSESGIPPVEQKEKEPIQYEVRFFSDRSSAKPEPDETKVMTAEELKRLHQEFQDGNERHHSEWAEVWRGGKRIAGIDASFPAGASMDYGALVDPDSREDLENWTGWDKETIEKEASRLKSTLTGKEHGHSAEHSIEKYKAASGGDESVLKELETKK